MGPDEQSQRVLVTIIGDRKPAEPLGGVRRLRVQSPITIRQGNRITTTKLIRTIRLPTGISFYRGRECDHLSGATPDPATHDPAG